MIAGAGIVEHGWVLLALTAAQQASGSDGLRTLATSVAIDGEVLIAVMTQKRM
ncbi:hypothetical protein GCM10011297_21340 [Bacterioplanes sanyensis]|nr:hypothetical protein GCM10011297_21340 [Bacterioplanes sanyensis]